MSGKFPIPDRLQADRAVLVVVDLQEKFRDLIHGMDQVLARTGRLIRFCQQLEIPIVVTEHYPKGLGVTIAEVRNGFRDFAPIEKINFSCCGCDAFNAELDRLGRDQVILCGIEAHVCIYQTAADLLRDGKQVALAGDAVSSCSADNRHLGLVRMAELGVQSMGVQMLMFEILREAGTPTFKKVAGLLQD